MGNLGFDADIRVVDMSYMWILIAIGLIIVGNWIGLIVGRMLVNRSRNETASQYRVQTQIQRPQTIQRCKICGGEIHRIPKIEEKEIVLNGVKISVSKIPMCCKCYEEYKKWSKIIDGGV